MYSYIIIITKSDNVMNIFENLIYIYVYIAYIYEKYI